MLIMPVRNNTALSRFELDVDGATAVVSYRLEDGVMTFFHTETPAHLQGRGIGSEVVKGALDAARSWAATSRGTRKPTTCWPNAIKLAVRAGHRPRI